MEAEPQPRTPSAALAGKGVFLQQGSRTGAQILIALGFLSPDSWLLGLQRHVANWKH